MKFTLSDANPTIPPKFKRVKWIQPCIKDLKFLCGDDILHSHTILETAADPLCYWITLLLIRPLQKGSREPLRSFLRFIAQESDCEIPTINITKRTIKLEVLIKTRHNPKELYND